MSVNSEDLRDDMLLSLDALEGVEPARPESKSDSAWWDAVLDQAAVAPTAAAASPSDDDLIADLREALDDRSSMGFQPVPSSGFHAPKEHDPVVVPSSARSGTGWNPMLQAGFQPVRSAIEPRSETDPKPAQNQPKNEHPAASVQPAATPAMQLGAGWNPMLPPGGVWNDFTVRDRLFAKLVAGDLPALRDIDIYVERGVISIRAVVVASAPIPMWPTPVAWASSPCLPPVALNQPAQTPSTSSFAQAEPVKPATIEPAPKSVPNDAVVVAKDEEARDGIPCYGESDDAVRERIMASLQATQIPGLMKLQVAVKGHSITLSGSVASDYERQLVLQMVRRECDAWHVRNGIAVVEARTARFAKLVEFSRDVWHVYRKEVLTIAALILVAVGYVFPWPTFAPAATYPVTTEAVFEKEPMSGATIVLHPRNWKLPGEACPVGKVDPRGKVTFSTFGDKDGVPAGEYVVTARWSKLITTPDGDAVPGPNVIPPVFADPATSPIRFRVDAKQADVVPIVFSSKIVSRNQ